MPNWFYRDVLSLSRIYFDRASFTVARNTGPFFLLFSQFIRIHLSSNLIFAATFTGYIIGNVYYLVKSQNFMGKQNANFHSTIKKNI